MTLPSRAEGRALAAAAFTVAALDLSYVWVLWVLIRQRITTEHLLQSIAAGLLGKDAYEGGAATAALGGVLHVLIAVIWCTIFWLLLSRAPRIRARVSHASGRVLVGLGWGALVWWLMDLVVLPLSRARPVPVDSSTFFINTAQHALMVGLPMALIIGRAVSADRAATPA